jgi:hemerythrin-like metal-binding protein
LSSSEGKTALIDPDNPRYCLGVESMDSTHQEFIAIVNSLGRADDEEFVALFQELLDHTESHFTAENKLMEEVQFPPIQIHMGEHHRVLEQMRDISNKVAQGSIATGRTFVLSIPQWFREHAATMDSALAGCVKEFNKTNKQ